MALNTLVTAYFSNGVVVEHRVGISRAIHLMEHKAALVPEDAELYEVRCASGSILVPAEIAFAVQKALVPPANPMVGSDGLYERDGGKCAYCGQPVPPDEATRDHVVPRCRGGQDTWENLVLACRRCNHVKADRTPEEAGMILRVKPHIPKVRLRKSL
jgi:hypothetical protein